MNLIDYTMHTLAQILVGGIQRSEIPALLVVMIMLFILTRKDKGDDV